MKRAILIAPGPSFSPEMLDDLHDLGDCYAVNRAIRAYQGSSLRPKGVFLVDGFEQFPDEMDILAEPEFKKIGSKNREKSFTLPKPGYTGEDKKWRRVPNCEFWKISVDEEATSPFREDDPNIYVGPLMTTLFGWWYLSQRYKQVCLIGADCSSGYYFEFQEPEKRTAKKAQRYDLVYERLKGWHEIAKERGCETINLSQTSRLADFLPTMTVEEMKSGDERKPSKRRGTSRRKSAGEGVAGVEQPVGEQDASLQE